MKIKSTNVKFSQEVKENSQIGKNLAKDMMIFADKNSSAVSKSEFQKKLNKMETLSTEDLIKFIRSFDKDESIIELICDEIGDDKKVRKEACKKVLNALVNKAKILGIDTSDFEKQFIEELDSQFGFLGIYINTNKLDSIINALTQSIENRQNLTSEDLQIIQNTSAEEGANQSNNVLENRLEKAYASFGERVGEDGEMTTKDKDGNLYNGQMQRDGLAADIADGVSRIWGSKNTAAKVRKDLKASNAQLQQLQEAKLQGEDAYKAKFKEIFGVEYDYANILAYQKAEQIYVNASANHEFEMAFNRNLKTLLSPAPLREEVRYDSPDPMSSMVITTVTATKDQVYNREFNNLANFIGEKGTEILNQALEEKGVTNGSIEEKFEVLKQIAQALSKQLHSVTLESGGGKEFSEVQAMYDNSYKAAYGVENDIMKRVTDYNISQETGAGVVKAGVTIAASLAAAFTGIGLAGVAAITAGTTVATEVVDKGTSGKALNALREDGVGAYIKTANDDIDWEATLKQAVISGGAVLIGGAVTKGVSIVMEGTKPAAQAIAQFGGDIVCDASMEYLTTGKITVEGMVFTVLLSAAGNIVAMKQLKATADATESVDEVIDGAIAQPEIDVKTKLANAGFTEDVIQNLKAESNFYGPELVDEVLDMIVYLEDQVAAGKPITRELIENAIDLYSPGASGGSAYTQRSMIANTWNKGDEVFNAYGQKAPGQSTFSTGNMKAKYNKIKNEINDYVDYKKWEWGLNNPTEKTVAINTSGSTTDFATKLADIKGPDGKPFLSKSEIDNLLENCQHGFVTDGKPIPDFEARIMAVLSNPEEMASLADWKSRSAGIWRAIQDPLQSTVDLNPAAFGVKPKATTVAEATDFATKLADIKGPDGKPFLSKSEIDNLLENCQHGFVTDGKPIPDFEARIMAVLSNPEEMANLADWKSRSAGIWRAIQDPLQSTVDLNPAVFGVKPKATTVAKQTAPSQKLPDVVDKIYGGKAEAEAVVFGNGTLADINPSIIENAIEELTKYFGREIKASDLQVIKNSKGAFISYFDPETNLATAFSNSGELNVQFKIAFDAQGNIQSFDLATIYTDGEFIRR